MKGAIRERSMEEFLVLLGLNLTPQRMQEVLGKINGDPQLNLFFHTLKRHVRPKAEAQWIKRNYLNCILKDGKFGFNIPEHLTVTGSVDVELTRKYLQIVFKTEVLNKVQIPDARNKLEEYSKILSERNDHLNQLTNNYIKSDGQVDDLKKFNETLISVYRDFNMNKECFNVFRNPQLGSENYRQLVLIHDDTYNIIGEILNIPRDQIDPKCIHMHLINCYKKLLNSDMFEVIVKCGPKNYMTSIYRRLVSKASGQIETCSASDMRSTSSVSNSSSHRVNLNDIMDYLEKCQSIYLSVQKLKSTVTVINQDFINSSVSIDEHIMSTVKSIKESVKKIGGIDLNRTTLQKESNSPVKTVLSPQQYSEINNIFLRWGVTLDSPIDVLKDCLVKKQMEYENYRSCQNEISEIQFDLSKPDLDFSLVKQLDNIISRLSERSEKIKNLEERNEEAGNRIMSLISSMPFMEIEGRPITDIIEEVKHLIVQYKLLLTMPMSTNYFEK